MTGKKRGPKVGSTNHSDYEKAAGVLLLATNKQDYKKTAEMLNVTEQTIRDWEKLNLTKNLAIPVMLEMAIKKLLEMMPDKWNGNSWAVALGILMDKWLLVHGQPTQRTASLLENVNDLSEEDKDEVLREAENIIRDAVSKKTGGGSDSKDSQEE